MSRDIAVEVLHAAWDAHTAACALDDDIAIRRAHINVLKAERDVEQESLDRCTQDSSKPFYREIIACINFQIEDEEAGLVIALSKLV